MRVFFCRNEERRVRNQTPIPVSTKEYPALALFQRGSLTVEAALVLPAFLLTMLTFLYFMKLAQGYEQVQQALAQTARAASQYGVLETERFYQYLEENAGDFSYVEGGKKGISLKNSFLSPVTKEIVVTAEYIAKFPVPFSFQNEMSICQEIKSRVFCGTDTWGTEFWESEEAIVYITKYGTVYHENKGCAYLNPSISMVWGEEVFQKRNNKGGKYKPCEACIKKKGVMDMALYITEEGDYYHSSVGCQGLNRTIYEVPISKAAGYHACNKCGG